MAKKIKVNGCPCCGNTAFWTKGNKDTRMIDRVQCSECFLEIEGTYKPLSSVEKWNFRVLDHYIKDTYYNIDGEIIS